MTRATCPSTTTGGGGVGAGVAVGVGAGVADGATDEKADGEGEVGPLQAASSNNAAGRLRRLIAGTVLDQSAWMHVIGGMSPQPMVASRHHR
jgi:hypothetical protein